MAKLYRIVFVTDTDDDGTGFIVDDNWRTQSTWYRLAIGEFSLEQSVDGGPWETIVSYKDNKTECNGTVYIAPTVYYPTSDSGSVLYDRWVSDYNSAIVSEDDRVASIGKRWRCPELDVFSKEYAPGQIEYAEPDDYVSLWYWFDYDTLRETNGGYVLSGNSPSSVSGHVSITPSFRKEGSNVSHPKEFNFATCSISRSDFDEDGIAKKLTVRIELRDNPCDGSSAPSRVFNIVSTNYIVTDVEQVVSYSRVGEGEDFFWSGKLSIIGSDIYEISTSIPDVTKEYDGSGWSFPNSRCPTTINFQAGDGTYIPVTVTYSPSLTSKNVNLAGYPITAHFEVNSSSYSNYHLDTDTKIFKAYITPRPLTFAYTKPVFDDKEYDGNPFPEYVVPTVTYDGLVSGDCVNVTGSASKDPSEWTKQVGTYSVNVSFNVDACTGTDLSNYSYTAPESYSDSAEITQKKLLVPCCPCPDEKYYDCHPFSISFPSVLTGKVGRDDAYLTYSPDNLDEYVDAGNYPVTFTFGIGGADAGNYKFVDEFGNDCNTRSTTYRIKPMYICYDMDTEPAILCDSVGEDGIPYKVYDGYPLVVRSPIIFVSGVSECDMNDDPHTAKIRIRSTFFPSVDTTFRKDARLYSTRVYYNHEVDDGVDEDNYNFVDAPYVAIMGYSDQGCGCGGHIYDETTRVCNGGLPESVELVGRIICKEITPVATVSMDGLEPVVEDVEFDMIAGDNLIVRTSCEVVELLDGYVVVRVHYLLDGIDRDNYCLSSAEEDVEVEFTPNEADFFEIVFVDEDGELDADVVCDGGACSVVYDAKIHYVTVRLKELEEGEIGSWLQDWVDGLSVDPESLKWIIEHNGETEEKTGEERVGKMHAGIYNISAYMMFDDGYELIGEVTFTINPRPLYLENLSVRYE